jgi:ATP adenylyltransferase
MKKKLSKKASSFASSKKSENQSLTKNKKSKTLKSIKNKKDSAENHIQLGNQIWPLERDILFRPDRLKYVRKLIQTDGCVFCQAKQDITVQTLCVYKSEFSMIVLNKFPYNPGHLLVLPLDHCGDFLKLSEVQYNDLHKTLKLAFKAITDIYKPEGINLGLNHGRVSGAGIPDHLHYHLVPRWFGDLNFFPLIADTKLVVMNLEDSYDHIRSYFKKAE